MGATGQWWTSVVGLLLAGCAVQAPRLGGPLPVRNQHPAQLTVLRLLPQDTVAEPAGGVELGWTNAYTSLFLAGSDGAGQTFAMDGEILRSALGARIGLGAGFELGLEVPVAHTSGGFLDEFIIDWHDWLGLSQNGRDAAPRDRYRIEAEVAGQTAWEVSESTLELLDVPVTLSWSFAEAREPGSFGGGLRAGIELPTGDDEHGYGSGEVDVAIGAFGEYRARRWGVTAHVEHAFAGQPEAAAARGLPFRDVTSAGVGGELAIADHWAAIVQVEWETSTLRSLGFPRAADDQVLLWIGTRVGLGSRTRMEFAVGEDLAAYVSPDVTFWLSLYHAFGGGR